MWHGRSAPYAHLPLNDALPGSRSFRVGRLPLIRQQQQQCCCYLIYKLPVLWRSGAAARWSRLHTPVETLTPPYNWDQKPIQYNTSSGKLCYDLVTVLKKARPRLSGAGRHSDAGKSDHQPDGSNFRQDAVELIEKLRCIDHPTSFCSPQRSRCNAHLFTVRQALKHTGIPDDMAHFQELRLHRPGADGSNGNMPPAQLLGKPYGKRGHISLGR